MVSPVIAASEPPVTMASAMPSMISWYDSPMACADEAQADTVREVGSLEPVADRDEAARPCSG